MVIPKFHTCPRDHERIPTQFEVHDDEIEFPGVHVCSKGHAFLTRLDPKPGAPTIDTDDVNWLTSCGTMHDYDLPQAYLRVELEDPMEGELAVVLRDARGGVAWRVWPIHAE